MSKREGPESPADALTSGDIFGEILDEVGGERIEPDAQAPVPAGRGPIKVQVSEPDSPSRSSSRPAARKAVPAVKELRPEDVDTLLDVFAGPAPEPEPPVEPEAAPEAAPEAEAEPEPEALAAAGPDPEPLLTEPIAPDELEHEAVEALEHEALVAEPLEAQSFEPDPVLDPLPLDVDAVAAEDVEAVPSLVIDEEEEEEPVRLVLDAIERMEAVDEPLAELAEVPGKVEQALEPLPPPPPPARSPGDRGTDEGLRDLLNLMRVSKGRTHHMASGPNKFTAAAPAPPAGSDAMDLASIAEQAFDDGAAGLDTANRPLRPVPKLTSVIHYGPYRLLQRIAVGGMAEVFRGKRAGVEGFEKVVAVKRILPHLSDNKEFVDMFIDEAKMVGGLTHPNIVQIFDLGKLEKTYFIAMEYVHGRDLRTILRRAREKGLRVPLDLAVLIVSRVCSALEFAHRKKDERGQPMLIVHRDVSPQNILISFEGEVKLTDFGIAKAATKATVTDAGALRGKLLYMSPEQAWGKPMDRRSDVFSLGIVLYEMATDQKPFLGNSEMSILEMVRECKVIPPSQANARIPEKLERVLMKALDRDVEERYQDAAEMFRDLERSLPERPAPTGVDLARFLEVLFDDGERSEIADDGPPSSLQHPGAPAEVHVEFDSVLPVPEAGPVAAAGAEVESPAEVEEPPAPAPPARDPMSIQKLLKRFGIK
jgi:serine/threonine protein kinase